MAGTRKTAAEVPQGIGEFKWSRVLPETIADLRISPDGRLVAAATMAGSAFVFELASGEGRDLPELHEGGAFACAFDPEGKLLATAGADGRVVLTSGGVVAARVPLGRGWIERIAWSPSGRTLACALGRSVIFLGRDGVIQGRVDGFSSTVADLLWSPEGEQLIAACYGGVRFLRVGQERPIRSFAWKGSVLGLAASRNGKWLVHGNQDASIHVWRMATGEDLEMQGFPAKVRRLAFRGDSLRMANASADLLILWDFTGQGPGGKKGLPLAGHEATVNDLVFRSRRGGFDLMSAGEDGLIFTWSSDRAEAGQVTALKAPVQRLAVDPADRVLLAASKGGHLTAFALA